MIRRPPRSTPLYSSAASDVYKRQVHHIADEGYCEERLYPARTTGDDADGPGRSDGGTRCVAEPTPLLFPLTAGEIGEHPTLLSQLLGGDLGFLIHETHDVPGELYGLIRIVGDAEGDQHVRPTHHTQTDLAIALGHPLNLRKRIAVHVYDIVQEANSGTNNPAKLLPIQLPVPDHQLEVDGTEVAALIGQ